MQNILLENLAYTRNICVDAGITSRHHQPMSIHKRIKDLRLNMGLSMEELASRVGVKSWQTVQQWEKEGGTAPKRDRLKSVATALETTEAYLLFGQSGVDQAEVPIGQKVDLTKYKKVAVIGKAMGGLPERIWDDAGYPVGSSDEYAEVATNDPNAFITPVTGDSMSPRFNPGEYALVEPNTDPEIEDDVLVRLGDGRTLIKRLLSRRGAIRLGSYNSAEIISSPPEEITWMYYVAHPVPARKIKTRM